MVVSTYVKSVALPGTNQDVPSLRAHSEFLFRPKSLRFSLLLRCSCILTILTLQGLGAQGFQLHGLKGRAHGKSVEGSGKKIQNTAISSRAQWVLYSRDPSRIRYEVTPATTLGPPAETKPEYASIHGPLGPFWDGVFLSLFRKALAGSAGFDSDRPGYDGVIDIACQMNKKYGRDEVQRRALEVLVTLFPSWMPPAYSALFSRPFPEFSSRMNAWATMVAGTWLMGECELNDVEIPVHEPGQNGGAAASTRIGKNQGLLVKRCRFLEEAGCASVCVHSCKIPTQTFFLENMGLPLLMEPNYDTFECQFSFGLLPTSESERKAMSTPCLARCPASQASNRLPPRAPILFDDTSRGNDDVKSNDSLCNLMEDVPL
jgi:Beta-carotene isomerase D27-like, C-terminal